MVSLARRNLFHDKVRFLVTLTGIVFSVGLATVQLGLFYGFLTTTSHVIAKSQADLWITSRGVGHLEAGMAFPERKVYQVLGTPGVARAERQIVQFGVWRLPSGADEAILLVGFNPDAGMGGPWNITEGNLEDLKADDTVFVDELYRDKLSVTHIGQTVEIRGYRARVVGFTRGIRSFTTSPPVFTSFKNAQNYFGIKEDQTLYILVKAEPGVDIEDLRRRVSERVSDVDVMTTAQWTRKQQYYWMVGTGAGVTVLTSAVLGLLVGGVVVAQTIYSATVDHIREYGTLKAIGASNSYIYRVIIKQAMISATIGFIIGMGISLVASYISHKTTTVVIVPWWMIISLFVLTLMMCVSASVVSIHKVMHLDPTIVFERG